MKKILSILLLIIKIADLQAQHPSISSAFDPKIGGLGNISSTCVATDDLGNIYLAGYFSNTVNLNNGITLTVGTVGNLFVAKYDKFGNTLWAKNFGSNNSLQQIKSIKVRPDGSEMYITGFITGVAVFGTTTLTPTLFGVSTTLYSDDIFVAKLLDNGGSQSFAWAVRGGGKGNDKSYELDYDNFGKIYIAGRLSSGGNATIIGATNVTFGSLPVINCVNSLDSYVARLTDDVTSATWDWVKTSSVNIACTNLISYDDEAFGLATNKTNGDVFITGYYFQLGSSPPPVISFGSTNMPLGSANEGYVAKLNTDGDWQWASKIGGITVNFTGPSFSGNEYGRAISVDSEGNAYIIGTFTNNVAFGNGGGSTSQIPILTSYGSDDVFIAKINDAGTWQWAKGMGGAERETAGNIAYKNGQIWATGTFRATATFKTANQLTMAGSGSGSSREDVYLVNIDKNANWVGDGATKGGGGSFDGSFDSALERIGLAIDNQNVPVATGNHIVSATSPPNPVYGPTTFTTSGNFVFRANSNETPPVCSVSMTATQPAMVNVSINSNANLRIKALLKDASGGSVIAGKLTGNVTITHLNGSQVTYLPSNGSAFVTHLNANNQAYWFEQMGGPDAIINDIAFSDEGIFVVGDFTGTGSFRYVNSRFGDDGFYIYTPISKGLSDIFVGELVSYNIAGNNEILFAWLTQAGGTGMDRGASIATHNGVFTAITGFVSHSTTGIIYGLNNTPLSSPPSGSSQLFVAAIFDQFVDFDFETYWVYFKSHTQPPSPVTAAMSRSYDIIVNASNEAIISGNYSFNDAVNASQAPTFGTTVMPYTNGQNLLVAKISNTGTWLWATKAGNNTTAGHFHNAVSLAWGEDNTFYLTGGIQHTGSSGVDVIKFGLTSTSEIQQMTTTQLNDILVAKLNTNGTWIWAKRGGGVNSDYGLGINFKNQKVFITGYFISSINLGGTNLVSAGSTDIYFAQLSKLGDWLPNKAQRGGGMSGDGYYDNNALPFRVSLDVDANDNAYSAGFYSNAATFGTSNLSNTFNGNDTAILLKAFCSTCTVSAIALSSPSNNIPSFNPEQKTASSITATNHVLSGNVLYQAGSFIELNPGFKVELGTVFKAQMGGCN